MRIFLNHILLWLSLFAGLGAFAAAAQGQPVPGESPRVPDEIHIGANSFEADLPGGETIQVFTYRPQAHGPDDPIMIVLAGGGRNGDDYRDAWIEAAERYRLLILAPAFDEAQFPGPISYNLAGMIGDEADVASLGDVTIETPETWLFADIEAIFDQAVARTGSSQTRYDLFGHSAGGQIAHRMVLFAPQARIGTAVAANSGWYTTPTRDIPFPYGLRGLSLPAGQLDQAFGRRLVILLGERDDESETRGHLRESAQASAQGPHRLARGRHFHAVATREAARLDLQARWQLEIVPNVGHDYRRMGEAAANLLYARE